MLNKDSSMSAGRPDSSRASASWGRRKYMSTKMPKRMGEPWVRRWMRAASLTKPSTAISISTWRT